jgi:hypothetical protein
MWQEALWFLGEILVIAASVLQFTSVIILNQHPPGPASGYEWAGRPGAGREQADGGGNRVRRL